MSEFEINRRNLLRNTGAALTAGLAGCGGNSGSSGNNSTSGASDNGTDAGTASADGSEGSDGTQTGTDTEDSDQTYSVRDEFNTNVLLEELGEEPLGNDEPRFLDMANAYQIARLDENGQAISESTRSIEFYNELEGENEKQGDGITLEWYPDGNCYANLDVEEEGTYGSVVTYEIDDELYALRNIFTVDEDNASGDDWANEYEVQNQVVEDIGN